MANHTAEHRCRCLCGSIRIRVTGEPLWVSLCHCETCRRATGGVFVASCGFADTDVIFEGAAPAYYESSPGVRRGFCPTCGTSLSYEGVDWPGEIHLMAGNFEHPERFHPDFHVHVGEKLPWLRLGDDLPRFGTLPGADDPIEDDQDLPPAPRTTIS